MKDQEDWTKKIDKLEVFFKNTDVPSEPIQLSGGATVFDFKLFVSSQLAVVKRHNGQAVFLPYLNRLKELKKVLEAK